MFLYKIRSEKNMNKLSKKKDFGQVQNDQTSGPNLLVFILKRVFDKWTGMYVNITIL